MSVVKIILDTDKLLTPSDGPDIVDTVAAYAPACLKMRNALHSALPITFHVRKKSAGHWMAQLARKYGSESAIITEITPRSILAESLSVNIPSDVTDIEIRQSRLLDQEIISKDGQAFYDVLLGQFYGEGYTSAKFHISHLVSLVEMYEPSRWQDAGSRPLVARAFSAKIDTWLEKATSESTKAIIRRLRDDPVGLRRDLCRYKVLCKYPEKLGRKIIGAAWDVFRKARVDTADLSFGAQEQEEVTDEVRYYLTSQKSLIASPTDLAALLCQVSGCLSQEYEFVETLLKTNVGWLSAEIIDSVEIKFRPIKGQISASLAQLSRLIQPSFPSAPNPDWNASEWLNWVVASYMPYYSWLEAANENDETIMEYATMFADWYFDQSTLLRGAEEDKFAFSALYRNRARLTEAGAVSLVLLIDNFNYVYVDELRRQFGRKDFTMDLVEPTLSLVPTATEICKASLIATTGDHSDLPTPNYAQLVETQWSDHTKGRSAIYLPNIGSLQTLSNLEHDIYFLNYLPIDKALHEDARETGRSHADAVRDHLKTLADTVADFANRFHIEDRMTVYVLSDHGATRIAKDVVNVLDKNFYKNVSLEKHHRFVALSDDTFEQLPQVASAQCYLIDKERFKTNQHYLAAKAYYRFLETSDAFYVHGGLTPEEVVVPFVRLSLAPVAPVMPSVRLLKQEYRYSKRAPLLIEVGNPNAFSLKSVSLRLIDQDSEEIIVSNIEGESLIEVGLPTMFRKVPGEGKYRTVTLRIRFLCQGQEFAPPDHQFDVTLKSLMEVTDDLEF